MISAREKFLGIVHFKDGKVMLLFPSINSLSKEALLLGKQP